MTGGRSMAIALDGTPVWAEALAAALYDAQRHQCRMRVYKHQGAWTIDIARGEQNLIPWGQ